MSQSWAEIPVVTDRRTTWGLHLIQQKMKHFRTELSTQSLNSFPLWLPGVDNRCENCSHQTCCFSSPSITIRMKDWNCSQSKLDICSWLYFSNRSRCPQSNPVDHFGLRIFRFCWFYSFFVIENIWFEGPLHCTYDFNISKQSSDQKVNQYKLTL